MARKKQTIKNVEQVLEDVVDNALTGKATAVIVPDSMGEYVHKLIEEKTQVVEEVPEATVAINLRPVVGDALVVEGKVVRVVEVLEGNNLHVKNCNAPYDSFIIDFVQEGV